MIFVEENEIIFLLVQYWIFIKFFPSVWLLNDPFNLQQPFIILISSFLQLFIRLIFSNLQIILWGLSESPTITNGAQILGIFPAPGKSHFSFNEAMMRSLHNAGHEITFVSPFPYDESLKNYSVVDSRNNTPIFIHMMNGGATRDFSYSGLIPLGIEIENKLCKDVLGSSEIQVSF